MSGFALAVFGAARRPKPEVEHWIGTWAAAPQSSTKSGVESHRNQTLRLVVHTSVGGRKVRMRISNAFSEQPLVIGRAHIARRRARAAIGPASDRPLTLQGQNSATVAVGSQLVSDPVDLDVSPLSVLAISLFLPNATGAMAFHSMALQTSFASPENGDSAAAVHPCAPSPSPSCWPI